MHLNEIVFRVVEIIFFLMSVYGLRKLELTRLISKLLMCFWFLGIEPNPKFNFSPLRVPHSRSNEFLMSY
jgi:hypothetical protein